MVHEQQFSSDSQEHRAREDMDETTLGAVDCSPDTEDEQRRSSNGDFAVEERVSSHSESQNLRDTNQDQVPSSVPTVREEGDVAGFNASTTSKEGSKPAAKRRGLRGKGRVNHRTNAPSEEMLGEQIETGNTIRDTEPCLAFPSENRQRQQEKRQLIEGLSTDNSKMRSEMDSSSGEKIDLSTTNEESLARVSNQAVGDSLATIMQNGNIDSESVKPTAEETVKTTENMQSVHISEAQTGTRGISNQAVSNNAAGDSLAAVAQNRSTRPTSRRPAEKERMKPTGQPQTFYGSETRLLGEMGSYAAGNHAAGDSLAAFAQNGSIRPTSRRPAEKEGMKPTGQSQTFNGSETRPSEHMGSGAASSHAAGDSLAAIAQNGNIRPTSRRPAEKERMTPTGQPQTLDDSETRPSGQMGSDAVSNHAVGDSLAAIAQNGNIRSGNRRPGEKERMQPIGQLQIGDDLAASLRNGNGCPDNRIMSSSGNIANLPVQSPQNSENTHYEPQVGALSVTSAAPNRSPHIARVQESMASRTEVPREKSSVMLLVAKLVSERNISGPSKEDMDAAIAQSDRLQQRVQELEEQRGSIITATAEPVRNNDNKRYVFFVVAILILALAVSLSIALTRNAATETERARRPTLETVLENGVVKCGVGYFATRSTDENGDVTDEGAEVDLCRAIAAAVFGDPSRAEILYIEYGQRWEFLMDGSIDVVTLVSTHTMERDVYLEFGEGGSGFGFTDPFYYDGFAVGGVPPFGNCADNLETFDGVCKRVRLCTSETGTDFEVMSAYMPDFNIRTSQSDGKFERFMAGHCNAIAGLRISVSQAAMENRGYFGPYEAGINMFAKDPSAMVTRNDDAEWLDFVNWVLRALKAAEEQNITMSTANEFMNSTVFGEQFENMFSNAIAAVGNYGEFYDRNFGPLLPREALNEINNGTTGLIYAYHFGDRFVDAGPEPSEGSTLDRISKRGYLRCGVVSSEWSGMDADYCRALSASIFPNEPDGVRFENLNSLDDGFVALIAEDIDVLGGGIVNLQNDVHEPTTGEGFSFSQPYFYFRDQAFALVTTEKDPQWSDFVYWLVVATFWAEERNIGQNEVDIEDLPAVDLFGPSYKDMFRNAVRAVGNYGDMYARNVESVIPRQGRNLPNDNPFGPQHISYF